MLEKKLLTLGGAVAILALGACFLPPPRPHKPPPPPRLPSYLAGIRTIAVHVEDNSGSNPFVASQLSYTVSDQMNRLWKESPIYFQGPPPGPSPDATLKIVIRQKSAVPPNSDPGPRSWRFTLLTASTLTTRDGRVVWQDNDSRSAFNHYFQQEPPSNPWTGSPLLHETAYALAISIGAQLLFVDPGNSKIHQAPGNPQ